ncbi:MAG: hypothetical protein K0S71_300 [Clostridia bacterium]|jgi:transcriptional regulator with XRE-family HTH domain|nr:hypothetical protein [Clostridia bacterium]
MGEIEIYKKEDGYKGLVLSALSDGGRRVLDMATEIRITCNLDEHLKALGLTQAELAQITGMRQATISELVTKRKANVSIAHMLVLMLILKIPKFSDMFEMTFDEETVEQMAKDRKAWEKSKKIPEEMADLMVENVLRKVR